ncbi:DUF3322 domain-containing protein [Salinicola sp. LHM]|jgi:hypothetical protein|uniref:DUF3322 domain-containing protein n=1 Tax=Salinicola sp. LHM TaxID=3065298 RepID=UPI002ACE0C19|nr:DUF3322 domain-containing protein [Salinicola sp. LHM]WQH32316.1 DUF3322 domain-containing protein [Salinicola sp. LHM]
MSWTSPTNLRQQMEKHWQRGDILRARLDSESPFPLSLRLRKPAARDLTERFAEVADWVRVLREDSRDKKGFGYTVHWRQRRHRVQGANDLPDAISVETEDDALRWLGRQADAERFSQLAEDTLHRFPTLHVWLSKHPLRLLEHATIWPRTLAVLAWFRDHPRPGLYLRELEIPGVHSKFIESHRGLLAELLDQVMPADAIDARAIGARGFNRRYGLRDKPLRVRFRLLDECLAIQGLTDLTVPVAEFARLELPVETVFITENEINGLAFPNHPQSLVIFGLGYGVETLADVSWLAKRHLYYWGDIDTHGFAILHRLRHYLPEARSLLMDRATLEAHRELWGEEDDSKRFTGELPNLDDSEQDLYRALRDDWLAPRLRLEQEHITPGWLRQTLCHLAPCFPEEIPSQTIKNQK